MPYPIEQYGRRDQRIRLKRRPNSMPPPPTMPGEAAWSDIRPMEEFRATGGPMMPPPPGAGSMIAPPLNRIDSTTGEEPTVMPPTLLRHGEETIDPESSFGSPYPIQRPGMSPFMPPPGSRISAPITRQREVGESSSDLLADEPIVTAEGEQIMPTGDFGSSYPMALLGMPPPPVAPRFKPPDPMSWQKALLGIGLSAAAGLSGQGEQTADIYFNEPRRRAETDFLREYGQFRDQKSDWRNVIGQIGDREDQARSDLMRAREAMAPDPFLVGTVGEEGEKVQQWYNRKTGLPMPGRAMIPAYVKPEEPEVKKLKLVQLSTGEFANYDETTGKIYDPDTGEEISDPRFYQRPLSTSQLYGDDDVEAYVDAFERGDGTIAITDVPIRIRSKVLRSAHERGVHIPSRNEERQLNEINKERAIFGLPLLSSLDELNGDSDQDQDSLSTSPRVGERRQHQGHWYEFDGVEWVLED